MSKNVQCLLEPVITAADIVEYRKMREGGFRGA